MLKYVALAAIAICASKAFAPMPRETVEASAKSGNQSQNRGQSDLGNTAASLAQVNQVVQPSASEPHGDPVGTNNVEQSVRITGIPSITVTDKSKSFWDRVFD